MTSELSLTLRLEDRPDGGLRVWSPDMPGLVLSGSDPELVMQMVWPAVAVLRAPERYPRA